MNRRIVHYLNQFFAGVGGESDAGMKPLLVEGTVGPGRLLQTKLGEAATVVGTVSCGDNYMVEHPEEAIAEILSMIRPLQPDLLVAGPAFQGGRYGIACGMICAAVARELNIPVVSGMDPENPGLSNALPQAYVVPSGASAVAMGATMSRLVPLCLKLLEGQPIGSPDEEGYLPRGVRRNVIMEQTAARRSVVKLLGKLSGSTPETEVPLPVADQVAPPPLRRPLSEALVALVTEGGIVPKGNPDGLKSARAESWHRYSIDQLNDLTAAAFESIHSGYDSSIAKADPDRVLPLDAMRRLEQQGRFGRLLDHFYSTTGNVTTIANSVRFGQEIGSELRQLGVDAVILTAT